MDCEVQVPTVGALCRTYLNLEKSKEKLRLIERHRQLKDIEYEHEEIPGLDDLDLLRRLSDCASKAEISSL